MNEYIDNHKHTLQVTTEITKGYLLINAAISAKPNIEDWDDGMIQNLNKIVYAFGTCAEATVTCL